MDPKDLASRFESAATFPDRVEDQVGQVILKIKRLLIPLVGALIVLVLVAMFVTSSRTAAREARADAFFALSQAMNNGAEMSFGPERDELLQARIGLLEGVEANHPDTQAATIAAFQIPRTHFQLGNYTAARDGFAAFAKEHPGDAAYASQAAIGEANALVELGEFEAALDKFLAISQAGSTLRDTVIVNQAKYRAALCALALERTDTARKLLEEILASSMSESAKQPAQSLLSRVDVLPVSAWKKAATLPEAEPEAGAGNTLQLDSGGTSNTLELSTGSLPADTGSEQENMTIEVTEPPPAPETDGAEAPAPE